MPRNSTPKALFVVPVVLAFLFMCTGAQAESAKDAMAAEIDALAGQLEQLKPGLGDPAVAAQYDVVLADYLRLVDLITYDPMNLRPSVSVSFSGGKAAPAAPPGGTSTTTSFSNNTPAAINDNATTTSMINVAGLDAYLFDVDLTTAITHTFASDLEMTLTSPGGTVMVITTDNGGGNDDVFDGTLFDDGATELATDSVYTNGVTNTPLVPEGAMGGFIGEDPNGTWTLEIFDDAGGDTGSLNSWTLDLTTLDAAPIETAASFSNNTPVAINDNATSSSDIVASGLDAYTCDVDVTIAVTHTFAADLEMTVTSPAGTVVTLSTDNGGGNDDVFNGTTFDDSAADTATDFTYTNGVAASALIPEGALAGVIGEDANGTWTLEIFDDAGGDTGSLNSWSLDVTTCVGVAGPAAADIPTAGEWGKLLFLLSLVGAGLLIISRRLF